MGSLLGCFGYLLGLSTATAAEATAGRAAIMHQSPSVQIFTFLFLMLGPKKIIGPFARITRGQAPVPPDRSPSDAHFEPPRVEQELVDQIRHSTTGVGPRRRHHSFFVALQTVLEQFTPPEPDAKGRPDVEDGFMPLAFPTIVLRRPTSPR